MQQTKITMKIFTPLLKKFNQQIDNVFIKRDALLNHVLKYEVERLAEELEGLVQSSKARRYISGELKRLGTTTINVVVDKEVADKLNAVVKQSNMARDAFANRFFLYLLSFNFLLDWLEVPRNVEGIKSKSDYINGEIPTSPLKAVSFILEDPFFYLRLAADEVHDTGIYLLDLPHEYDGLKLDGFTCYMEDKFVPSTPENEQYLEEMDKLFEKLGLSFSSKNTKEDAK